MRNGSEGRGIVKNGRWTMKVNLRQALITGLVAIALLPASSRCETSQVSVAQNGTQSDGTSVYSAVSGDGQYVAFYSSATNLSDPAGNGSNQIFVKNINTGEVEIASVSSSEIQGTGSSYAAALSEDGNVVVFASAATNLVAGDSNGVTDIFVRDRSSGTTRRANLASDQSQATGTSSAYSLAVSADGRYVLFASSASNLVGAGVDTNSVRDVFLRDMQSLSTQRVSVRADGSQNSGSGCDSPSMSADASVVAFVSDDGSLVDDDSGSNEDVFVKDLASGAVSLISRNTQGVPANAASAAPAVSGDGRYVAFYSGASDLVPGDTNERSDIFLYDRNSGLTSRISVGFGGAQSNGHSFSPAFGGNSRYVAFLSMSSNLLAGGKQMMGSYDVYTYDIQTGKIALQSISSEGAEDNHNDPLDDSARTFGISRWQQSNFFQHWHNAGFGRQ
jgi:hypothetical protein